MNAIAEIIATARRARDLTQEELANDAGITQAALSRYEAGLRYPEAEALVRLSVALGVTPELLESGERTVGAIAAGAHMRRRRTARPKSWRNAEAQLMMARLHSSCLFDRIQAHAENAVPLLDLSGQTAAQCARTTRMQWRMPSGPVTSIVAWIESAGIVVFERDLGADTKIDGLSTTHKGIFVIMINSSLPPDRKRWTLAHELGHLVMHTGDIYLEEDAENEANQFAAEFLLPEIEMRPVLRNLTTANLLTLKRHWGVSMEALVERTHGLELLSGRERSAFYKKMSARGYLTHEPGSEALNPERPAFPTKIAIELSGIGLTSTEIARITGFATPEDNDLFVARRPGDHLRVVG